MKLLLEHLKFFSRDLMRAVIVQSSPYWFVTLSNLRFRILGIPTRFQLTQSDTGCLYSLTDKSCVTLIGSFHFNDKLQGYRAYKNGLEARIKQLKTEYLVDGQILDSMNFVIDCGANVGDFYLVLKQFGFDPTTNLYLGIEPDLDTFACLAKNVSSPLNLGLYNEIGFRELFIPTDKASASFIRPKGKSEVRKTNVTTLDAVVSDAGISSLKIQLIKLEAEGCEPEVLQGSINTLRKTKYVVVDVGPERGEDASTTLVEVTNFMIDKGFKLKRCGSPRLTVLFENLYFDKSS